MGVKANVLVGTAAVTITTALSKSGGLKEAGVSTIATFYTIDGVQMSTKSSFANVKVEEIVGTIKRQLVDQEVEFKFTFAEGELANLVAAIPGSSINVGKTAVTIGGGLAGSSLLQEFALTIVGVNSAGTARTIAVAAVNPTGEVGIPYKKGEVSVIPVTFSCIAADTGVFCTITDG